MPIKNNVVHGEPVLKIPAHLSFGQHVLDKLREHSVDAKKIALVHGDIDQIVTYRQFLQEVVSAANGLKQFGVKRGDIVALCSENRLEFMLAAIGIILNGATLTTLSPQYAKGEIKHVLNISKPTILIASEAVFKQNLSVYKEAAFIKNFIQLNGEPVDSSIIPFKSVCIETDPYEFEATTVQGATDTVYLLYSSGTTGLPKGVMLTHLNILYSCVESEIRRISRLSRSCYLTVVPWYHAYGLMTTINFMSAGKTMVFFQGFYPEKYLRAIEKYKVNVLLTVPPMVVYLTKSPIVKNYDVSSVTLVWCAAAPISLDVLKDLMKCLPNCEGVLQAYGMTETSTAVTTDRENDMSKYKQGSGGYPLPGVRLKVVDVESRRRLGPMERGEICVKGPVVMKGYLGDAGADGDITDEEGYLKTGDIGYYDNDGCIFIVDRIKELIKYKGHQVAPAAVESVVLQHPSVAECGVVGAPHPLAGELPTAFVVLKPGTELTEKELLTFTSSKLSPSTRLHGGVIFVKDIPKNASGKILRRVLKQKLQETQKSKL